MISQLKKKFYVLVVLSVSISPAFGQTTNSMASNNDWTNAVAWSLGHVPSGTETAEIQTSVTATGHSAITNVYSGNMILREGASFLTRVSGSSYLNFFPSDVNKAIYLYNGSLLYARYGDAALPHPIVIDGAVTIQKGVYYNASTWTINSVISGSGSLTWSFLDETTTHSNREIIFAPTSPCTYTGGTTVNSLNASAQQRLQVKADGAFGTGNVTIKTYSEVYLSGTTSDTIADTAALYIEGGGVLNLGSNNETVYGCYIDGVKQPDGDYTSAETWLAGTGTLTVKGPPSGTVMIIK